ncbi:MAG TPA: phosphoglycerate kinase [Candidatus Babeliales bacterium]|nr:phosphoglycerate kinase [Candidatus Babeliales bacterium]
MYHSTFTQWIIKNKRIFVRADLNVTLNDTIITNEFRLKSILPTIDFILKQEGSIVLATHIGRPIHKESNFSTKILLPWFEKHGYSLIFIPDISTISTMKVTPRQIILLENLRFFPGEKNGDPLFAKQLASTADYYINDAFGTIHRSDCSTSLLPYEFSENKRSIGFLIEKELRALNKLKDNPSHPFIAIIGGGKVEDKIPLLHNLLKNIDALLLCPAICFSFLKSLGHETGQSLVNNSTLSLCKKIILEAEQRNVSLQFPLDYQVTHNSINEKLSIVSAAQFSHNLIGISIGPKTVEYFSKEINNAKTILFNCAMGFSDRPETRQSAKDIIDAMTKSSAETVVAGGDSIDIALSTKNYRSISHLSSGGGAALAYLSDIPLPGLAPFEEY